MGWSVGCYGESRHFQTREEADHWIKLMEEKPVKKVKEKSLSQKEIFLMESAFAAGSTYSSLLEWLSEDILNGATVEDHLIHNLQFIDEWAGE